MRKPQFHAEYNPTIIYFIPTVCWMELEDEKEQHVGYALQVHFLGISLQWFWDDEE